MSKPLDGRPSPLSIRLTETERQALVERAGVLPVSTYIKRLLFDGRAPGRVPGAQMADRILLARVLATLGGSRLAGNVEALALAAASGNLLADEDTTRKLCQACDDLRLMHNALMRGLDKDVAAPSDHEKTAAEAFRQAAAVPDGLA